MKIVIAIDSFKGSLSTINAGNTIKKAITDVIPQAQVMVKPLADGGEGTVDSLIDGLKGKKVELTVTGPLESKVNTYYGHIEETETAVMEMASASGITLIRPEEKNPMAATTYGVGEMILHAMNKGCRNFIIGIGGSATNDGGVGMLRALGFKFLDSEGNDVGNGGQALSRIASIDVSSANPLLKECNFKVACDVNNPLCGPNGATYIYGPQKGVTEEIKKELDEGMANYAKVACKCLGVDNIEVPGAGAAGGLGFGFLTFLNAKLLSGIKLVNEITGLEDAITNADIVITGEGRIDGQTAMGKGPIGVAKIAKKYGCKVIAFSGSIGDGADACNVEGMDAYFPILRKITSLEDAMDTEIASSNLYETAKQVFSLVKAFMY